MKHSCNGLVWDEARGARRRFVIAPFVWIILINTTQYCLTTYFLVDIEVSKIDKTLEHYLLLSMNVWNLQEWQQPYRILLKYTTDCEDTGWDICLALAFRVTISF